MALFGPPNVDKMKAKRDVQGLLKALEYGEDKPSLRPGIWSEGGKVRAWAAMALAELGESQAMGSIVTLLHDKEATVRSMATQALEVLRDPRASEYLIQRLGDPFELTRKYAAHALGALGDARAVEPLTEALSDPAEEVRDAAASALAKLNPPEKAPAPPVAHEGVAAARRAYAIVLLGQSVPGDPWSDGHAASLVRQRSDQLGYPVHLLGSVDCAGPFPTGPDSYVIATALSACERHGIPFESTRDQIAFQPVSRSGREVGLITIEVSLTAEAETAATPPAGEGPALDPEVEKLLREQGFEPAAVLCSGCGRKMWRYPSRLAGSPALFGNVCTSCKSVFCRECIQVGGATPCPRCGTPTGPAGQSELLQIGVAI